MFLCKKKQESESLEKYRKTVAKYKKLSRRKRRLSDREYIVKRYRKVFGRTPDLDNPTLYTEKIQWIKLNYKDPLYAKCADKWRVREYVEQKGYAHLLIPLLGVYERAEDIDFEALPEKFILKANHACDWNVECTDKAAERAQWTDTRKLINRWLEQDYSIVCRENHYTDIPPRMVCEKFIEQPGLRRLTDIRIFCFHGEPKLILVGYFDHEKPMRDYFDPEWNLTDIRTMRHDRHPSPMPKPENLDEMLDVARALSADFLHVRVDLYYVGGKIYFGELTFTPAAGFAMLKPDDTDALMGSWLNLPLDNPHAVR